MVIIKIKALLSLAVGVMVLFSYCSRDNGISSDTDPTPMTSIKGSVVAFSVSGAKVSAISTNGQTIAGPVTTAEDGTFSIDIPTDSLSSVVSFESDSGTFIDEASAQHTTAGKMAAYLKGVGLQQGFSVNMTPTSTIIHDLAVNYDLTREEAGIVFDSAFGYTEDLSVTPKNAPLSGADTDTLSRLAYIRTAAFSQLTKDLGLAPDKQFELLSAIARDMADGILDGKRDNAPVSVSSIFLDDIQCKFSCALATVLKDTVTNRTCLNAAQIGCLPFGKTVLTSTYKIEYIPGMMAAAIGKTSFKFKVALKSDGSPATGLNIALMPVMYMATKNHSTPFEPVIEDRSSPGIYNCTIYYLMASGPGMGYWELKTTIGSGMSGETAIFYPEVGMAMGTTTVRATLKGQLDSISGSPSAVQRTYFLFNEGLTDVTTFNIFLAARETMMNHPAVSTGTVLHDASNTAWTVDPIVVSASTDKMIWVDAVDNDGGHWTAGLPGLSTGVMDTIYVRVTVNGEQKTTDGMAPSKSNGYGSFTVTP
jgi:hypothetical protein